MKKQMPNKLTTREVKHILDKFKKGKLNITQEAKRLGIARRSIYFHLWKHGVLVKKTQKKKSLWQRIGAYFGIQISGDRLNNGSMRL